MADMDGPSTPPISARDLTDRQQRVLGIGKYDNSPMTADQQIRVEALKCAALILERRLPDLAIQFGADAAQETIDDTLEHFESYIRNGK